jgi:hypothetical protein
MRIFILSLFISFSLESYACMPLPLKACTRPGIKKDEKEFQDLLKRIQEYQKFLSLSIRGNPTHSCFNNGFAVMYGDALLKSMQKNNGKTCEEQLNQVEKTFKALISSQSDEFRAVPPASKLPLAEKEKIISVKINNFFQKP